MERADRDPDSDHEDHDNPTFHVEERERAMFPVFPGDPFGMFIEKPFKDQIEEKQENDGRFPDLE